MSPGLIGVDGETGTILWELPGHRQIAAVGDGYAIIGDGTENVDNDTLAAGWVMIDTSTGVPVDGQSWPGYETFQMNYSMEEDGQWVRRDGGVVIAVDGDHVRVWMPSATSTGTISVSLPA